MTVALAFDIGCAGMIRAVRRSLERINSQSLSMLNVNENHEQNFQISIAYSSYLSCILFFYNIFRTCLICIYFKEYYEVKLLEKYNLVVQRKIIIWHL